MQPIPKPKTIILPTSKSECNRYLIVNALCGNKTEIEQVSEANDTQVLKNILDNLAPNQTIDCQDAGTVARFLTAFLAVQQGSFTLVGSPRLQQRPIGILVDALNYLGAEITYLGQNGCLPLHIKGKNLRQFRLKIDASISSQYISALMMLAPTLEQGLEINLLKKVSSEPYIRLTAHCLKAFGIDVLLKETKITIKNQAFSPPKTITPEGDWSAASYWYGLVGLGFVPELMIQNLSNNGFQGDAILPEIFGDLGVKTTYLPEKNGILLTKIPIKYSVFCYDFTPCPDLAPTLMSYCAAQGIEAKFDGLESLFIKESDRVRAMETELTKFGIKMRLENSVLYINGDQKLVSNQKTIEIGTHHDHRIAMAMALWLAKGYKILFEDKTVVAKSYPNFWEHLLYAQQ